MSAAGPLAFDVVLQSRGVGLHGAFREGLPGWAVDVFAAVTHLGDTAFLLALAAALYLAYDRDAGAFVLGALFCGFALVIGAKAWFALPRPPTELRYVAESGFGFPSGHAVGATVGWGAMALALERPWDRRRRLAAAGVVAAAVSLSRVAIGVHYLVDVVAGVAVGLAVLAVAAGRFRAEPLGLFGLAAALAAVAVAAAGASVDSLVLLGASVGAVGGWQLVEPAARPYGRRGLLAVGGIGLALGAGVATVDPASALGFTGAVLLAVGVLVVPAARTRWLAR